MNDIFETGTYKYATVTNISDGLDRLTDIEEMQILSEMFENVSTEEHGYLYYDKASELKGKFEELTDCGNKLWIMDFALYQVDRGKTEIHDLVYAVLTNEEMAKRIGFKKIFAEDMLFGDAKQYNQTVEMFIAELDEVIRYDSVEMIRAFNRVMDKNGRSSVVTPYPKFAHNFREKVMGLKLHEETRLLIEIRSLLEGHDDFIFGLRMTKGLYEDLENAYKRKKDALESAYAAKVQQLYGIASHAGIKLPLALEAGGIFENMIPEPEVSQ